MNRQEIFDRVCDHLMSQARKSRLEKYSSGTPTCRYRMETAAGAVLKCAIGCLIPDGRYNLELEGLAARQVIFHALGGRVHEDDIKLLLQLQGIHDTFDLARWPTQLAERASSWGLRLPDSVQKALETPGWPGRGPRGRAGPEPLPGPLEGAR